MLYQRQVNLDQLFAQCGAFRRAGRKLEHVDEKSSCRGSVLPGLGAGRSGRTHRTPAPPRFLVMVMLTRSFSSAVASTPPARALRTGRGKGSGPAGPRA